MFGRMMLRRRVDRGGTQSKFVRCYEGSFMDMHMRRKIQIDCRTVPGWLKQFSDMLSDPHEYLQEAACPLQGLTGIPPDVLGDEFRAQLMYAYEACVSACCLCIRPCSVNGRLVLGVFPLAENKPLDENKKDHTLDNYVRPNRV
jgi:hypothetical protein